MTTPQKNDVFSFSRKTVRRLKWIHPAIIPHIPTNKPSSAEIKTGNIVEAVLSTNSTEAMELFDCFAQVRQMFR